MKYTENEIQGLKAQEAKDYCLELMQQLEARQGGPISPGEVQLQELQYELQLKEAEAEDRRQQELHQVRLREFELEIEREKSAQAEAERVADEVRARHAEVIGQVAQSQEKLSIQLERATREHNVKMQVMQAEHETRRQELEVEIGELTARRDALVEEIGKLADLQNAADDIDRLRQEIEQQRVASVRQHKQLDEEIEAATFEKQKELTRIGREQELEMEEQRAAHRKLLLDAKLESADQLLQELGYTKVLPAELASLQGRAAEQQAMGEQEVEAIRHAAVEEFKKRINLGSSEEIDVTALFYREKALEEENASNEKQIRKLDEEIARMRTHIEQESVRVAKSIEAARTNIQNNIEPGVKR